MKLFLVRHGDAKNEAEDPARPLTDEGARKVETIAAWLSRRNAQVAEIQHSGKTRAEQTAAIFATHLSPARGVTTAPGLKPNDDVRPVAERLENRHDSLMIVGHLPFLSRLASFLVAESPKREVVRFQTGGVVCLAREEKRWTVAWSVDPHFFFDS